MAPGSPASLLETWFRAVRKHHSFRSSPPCPGGPQTPLEHRTQPKSVDSHTACGAQPAAHIWRKSWQPGITADKTRRTGSAPPGWQCGTRMAKQRLKTPPDVDGKTGCFREGWGRDGGDRDRGKKKKRRGREGERGPSSLFKLPIPPSSWQNILSLKNNNNSSFPFLNQSFVTLDG